MDTLAARWVGILALLLIATTSSWADQKPDSAGWVAKLQESNNGSQSAPYVPEPQPAPAQAWLTAKRIVDAGDVAPVDVHKTIEAPMASLSVESRPMMQLSREDAYRPIEQVNDGTVRFVIPAYNAFGEPVPIPEPSSILALATFVIAAFGLVMRRNSVFPVWTKVSIAKSRKYESAK